MNEWILFIHIVLLGFIAGTLHEILGTLKATREMHARELDRQWRQRRGWNSDD